MCIRDRLHASLNSARSSFDELIPLLLDHNYRILLYDRWGNGRSRHQPRPRWSDNYHLEDAEQLVALLREHGSSQPHRLIGNSDGNVVGLVAAALAPELVKSIVLCGGTHAWNQPTGFDRETLVQIRGALHAEYASPEQLAKFSLIHGGMEAADEAVERWIDWWIARTNGDPPQADNWSIAEYLTRVECAVLCLHGTEDWDPTHQVDHAREVVQRFSHPESKLVVLEGIGHWPAKENPALAMQLIHEFENCLTQQSRL
eukprot:TRINITY_DN5275_c0_g2_i1.p1 TRINITY_DN5275_c0_g2~~TRINITY_DN5275_c0_g2_i1.p1  ORF type:complete len:258 (-),score=51.44 TRINITY_DN5275_c0_g2_i1:284-1057(-)